MRKIKVLFIQEKQIKNRAKVLTLGDLIEKEVPDTYEIDYVSIKKNVIKKRTLTDRRLYVCSVTIFCGIFLQGMLK